MKNISKYVEFCIDCKHSNKTNKDYYPLILRVNDIEIYVGFISKSQYDLLSSTLN